MSSVFAQLENFFKNIVLKAVSLIQGFSMPLMGIRTNKKNLSELVGRFFDLYYYLFSLSFSLFSKQIF